MLWSDIPSIGIASYTSNVPQNDVGDYLVLYLGRTTASAATAEGPTVRRANRRDRMES